MHRLRATQQQQDGRSTAVQSFAAQKATCCSRTPVPHGRARSTRPAARPPEFARRAPTGMAARAPAQTYHSAHPVAKNGSVCYSCTASTGTRSSYSPQIHTFTSVHLFRLSEISEKTLAIVYSLERDCVKVLTIIIIGVYSKVKALHASRTY
jgi:hypothetical protein